MTEIIDIYELIEKISDSSKDQIMVNKDLLYILIAESEKHRVSQLLDAKWGEFVPDANDLLIEDPWFRAKAALICRKLGVSQGAFAKEAVIDQGDLSKFISGAKPFGPQRKEKLLGALKRLQGRSREGSAA